jgi:hypothetical protein
MGRKSKGESRDVVMVGIAEVLAASSLSIANVMASTDQCFCNLQCIIARRLWQ